MFKKWGLSAAALLLTSAVILPGCASKKEEPKEAVKSAATKVIDMSSFEMKSKMTINNLTMETGGEADESTSMVLNMLKNADLSIDAIYQAEPMQTEMMMMLNLKGDMAMSFNIPMVMTTDKLYIKVPSIPFFPIPETIVGKFVEIDPKELAEQQGTEFNPSTVDPEKAKNLYNEVISTVLAEYDEDKYFTDIKPKDAALPEGVEAKQVIQFKITNDNVKEALTILVNNAVPKVIDILGKEEYKEMLQIDNEDLANAKAELQSSDTRAEFDEGLAQLDQYLTINQFNLNTAINKDDFPVYQDMIMDILVKDPELGENIGLSLTATNQYSKINEKQTFNIGIPQGDDVITIEELQQEFGGLSTY